MKAAHETGKRLELPVYSLDRLIIEALVSNSSEAANEINSTINQAFEDVAEDEELQSPLKEGKNMLKIYIFSNFIV